MRDSRHRTQPFGGQKSWYARHMLKFISKYAVVMATLLIRVGRFLVIVGAFYILYRTLLDQALDGSKQIVPALLLWLISAYIVVPKIHRSLTTFYLPNYYVGRIRSGSGLLADPINLVFFGSATQVHAAMKEAGWIKADRLTPKSFLRAAVAVMMRKSYPAAPVGTMYLFNKEQNFAYEIEIGGTPAKRHHVRFWRAPKGWRLPGGHKAEWLAAATYDSSIGLKLATGQIDHLIHVNIDEERDFVIESLQEAKKIHKFEVVKHFSDAYHDRNNGGDKIKTDGNLPFIYL